MQGLAKQRDYGEQGVRKQIALSIAYLNEACNRSGINARFRLVYAGETTWHAETSSGMDELYWLANDSTVAQWRAQVGADLVSLFVRDGYPTGGLGQLPGSFSIYNGSPFVFAHETGHNLGCAHDRAHANLGYDQSGCNYGYSFVAPGSHDVYGDIMSYVGSQIQQFSNPDRYFMGAPTGLPEGHEDALGEPDASNNALVINRALAYVALSEPSRIPTLSTPSLSSDGREFRFRLTVPETASARIEYSSDHRDWTLLGNYAVSSGGADIVDRDLHVEHRFYRAQLASSSIPAEVGFAKRTVRPGWSMISNPLDQLDNTVGTLLPRLAEGVQVYKWIEGRQRWQCNAFSFGEWDDPSMSLNPGEGVVLHNPTGAPLQISFTGELNQACYNRVPVQFSIRSATMPQAGKLSASLGYIPFGTGGQVYRMTGADGSYTTYTLDEDGWSPEEPEMELGEAFWSRNPLNAFVWQGWITP
ncbi:MAG: zinc-dependent metalloprotease family protein [Verrucomicrobiota bacterium]